ncbi:UNVERIFIED_CONTAM: hypothetical protein Slati_3915800 [Sesamum latifolium]|uniref:Uncharacterized protein n=1 Tax=Sesamum latifolium TaxID=2727402 RepID=A0AAW2TNG5_9LAMI
MPNPIEFCIQAVVWWLGEAGYHSGFTIEAEYIASFGSCEGGGLDENYIQQLGVVPSIAEPVVIFCDNNGAIAQAKELRSHHVPNTFLDATTYSRRW